MSRSPTSASSSSSSAILTAGGANSNSRSGSPRKFSEKIALLNKKEAEANAEFEKIIKEVEETTRAQQYDVPYQQQAQYQSLDQQYLNYYQPQDDNSQQGYHQALQISEEQQHLPTTTNLDHHQHHHHHTNTIPTTQHNVPNITIFPIEDYCEPDVYNQQQQSQNQQAFQDDSCGPRLASGGGGGFLNSHNLNGYSNSISSARSLPDIARVTEDPALMMTPTMMPSYSDRRLSTLTTNNQIAEYDNNHLYNNHHYNSQQTMPATTTTTTTTVNNNDDFNSQYNNQHSSSIRTIFEPQNSWHNSDTLNTPRMNTLSKSLDDCYNCNCCHRVRSNSYNNR